MQEHQAKTGDASGGSFLEELVASHLKCSTLIGSPQVGIPQAGAHWANELDEFVGSKIPDIKDRMQRAVARRSLDLKTSMESAKCALCLVARGGEVIEHRANPWYKDMTIDK